jgi:hypothetical protein
MMLTDYKIDFAFGVFEADGNAMLMRRGNQRDREAALRWILVKRKF